MKKRRIIRIIAIVLVVLLAGGVVVSALMGAFAEAAPRSGIELDISYLEDEGALRIEQRLTFVNDTGEYLDRLMFNNFANIFARDDADAVGGAELTSVEVNGVPADYGFQGVNELFLRVAVSLMPGESCEARFEYTLLLTRNDSFSGMGYTGVRLANFYYSPCVYEGGFLTYAPVGHARLTFAEDMDFRASISPLDPGKYLLAASGEELAGAEGYTVTGAARDFGMVFGRRYREYIAQTPQGTKIRLLANRRPAAGKALDTAVKCLSLFEEWFGEYPFGALDIAQADVPDSAGYTGLILVSDEFSEHELIYRIAEQYFGLYAYADPVEDAWLSAAVCQYLYYLAAAELHGESEMISRMSADITPALQMTVPGSLYVTSSAANMTAKEFEVIVKLRGAAVMHEMRLAMGKDAFIEALKMYCDMAAAGETLGEYDLLHAFDAATGGDWEAFLTDWLYTIGGYTAQSMQGYE